MAIKKRWTVAGRSLVWGLLAGVALPVVQAASLDWDGTQAKESRLILSQSIRLAQKDNPTRLAVELKTGEPFRWVETQPLEGIAVYLLRYQQQRCVQPQLQTEMAIVTPQSEGARDQSVGVQLVPGCVLEVFVESADFYAASLFGLKNSRRALR